MIVAMLPIIRNHCNPTLRIAPPHTRILQYIAFLIVVCGLAQIPNIISNFGSGFLKLFTDADAGRDAYMEGAKGSEDVGAAISNLPAVVFNAFSDIAIFLAMYYATLSSKKVWCTLLWITVGISLLIPVFSGQRTGVITGALTIFGAYLLFKKYLGKKTNFIFQSIAIIAAIIILLPVGAITRLPAEGLAVILGCSRLESISVRAEATDLPSVLNVPVPVWDLVRLPT